MSTPRLLALSSVITVLREAHRHVDDAIAVSLLDSGEPYPQEAATTITISALLADRMAESLEAIKTPQADKLRAAIALIDAFEKRCNVEQYTDVGDAWQVEYQIRNLLKESLS